MKTDKDTFGFCTSNLFVSTVYFAFSLSFIVFFCTFFFLLGMRALVTRIIIKLALRAQVN